LSRNPYKTRALGAGTNDGKMRGLVREVTIERLPAAGITLGAVMATLPEAWFTPHQSPHFSIVGTGAESAGFVGVSAQSGLEHRGGQGG